MWVVHIIYPLSVVHNISIYAVGYMPWVTFFILWVTEVIWCGQHHGSPHHIHSVLSTAYPPHHIYFVLSTPYTGCRPHHIFRCPPHKLYMMCISALYAVDTICIWCGSVDSVPYGVDDICAVDNMVWTSCVYAVGDIGYAVGICCGEHLLVLYGVENHMVWRTVVHTIYDLLSTLYIWCGHMVWVHTSFTDVSDTSRIFRIS